MKIVCVQIYFEQHINPAWKQNLLTNGWTEDNYTTFSKKLNKFFLKFQMRSFMNQTALFVMKKFNKYIKMPQFELSDIWNKLWSKEVVPKSIEIYAVEDYSVSLLQSGWNREQNKIVSPDKTMIYEELQEQNQSYYRFTDYSPCEAQVYMERLQQLGIQ